MPKTFVSRLPLRMNGPGDPLYSLIFCRANTPFTQNAMAEFAPLEIDELHVPIPESFQGFDTYGELKTYSRNLPHWRQDGATYFVTFRTADSIPETVSREMHAEAEDWKIRLTQAMANHDGTLPDSVRHE